MIAKLRIKFVSIMMLMVTIVMLLAFYFNYVIIKTNMYEQSIQTLEDVLKHGRSNDAKSFIVKKDVTGIYQQPGREREDIELLVEEALLSESDVGEIEQEKLRFMKINVRSSVHIAFTSTVEENITLYNMMRFSTFIIICCSFVILGISVFLAYIATKPISKSITVQKQLIADASHELKTPVTAIIASTDVLLSDASLTPDEHNWISGIKTSAEDMSFLISDMLQSASNEKKHTKNTFAKIDLSDVVTSTCLNFEAVFFEAGKEFSYTIEDNLIIMGNLSSIKQLIRIFLDNACKHSNNKGRIHLSLKAVNDYAELFVHNTGTQIPQEELANIFDRFYRVDKSRSSTSGSGLGLSIAKRIAEEHSTKIGVGSEITGTYFCIDFKLSK